MDEPLQFLIDLPSTDPSATEQSVPVAPKIPWKAGIVVCVDSPGYGGSEIDLCRILHLLPQAAVVVHSPKASPQLTRYFSRLGIRTETLPVGNSWQFASRGLTAAARCLRRHPGAAFFVWAHHADSYRWLQLALALAGRRFVVVERLIASGPSEFRNSRLSIPIKRLVARRATCVVLNAASQVTHYRTLFGLSDGSIRVIGESRPVTTIADRTRELRAGSTQLRAKLGLPNAPVILSVARLSAQKRLANLIEAIREVQTGTSPPVLVLVGDGPDRPELERLARECIPGRAIFTGYQADPISWLAAADVFALPSACEGLPGALIEAMAAGLPCVATDIPGNRDLIRHEITGLLVPVDSTDGLASAITRVLSDRDLAERLARSGQDLVFAEFDEGREFQAWDALFTELAVASQRDAPRGRPMSRAD